MLQIRGYNLTSILPKVLLGMAVLAVVIGAVFLLLHAFFFSPSEEISLSEKADLNTISEKKDFKLNEEPEFEFEYKEKPESLPPEEEPPFAEEKIPPVHKETSPLWEREDIEIKTTITNPKGEVVENHDPEIEYLEDGKFVVKLPSQKRDFVPGKYHLSVIIEKDGDAITQEQDFTWGVLAINVNKSIYLSAEALAKEGLPDEEAYLQMGVLDDDGHTICDANLVLSIKYLVSGIETILSTEDGTIQYSGKCGPDNVTDVPDYFAYYQLGEAGVYQMELTNIDTGTKIEDSFEVRESVPFSVERIGPTRIYPPEPYTMTLKIKANQDFEGQIVETVPESFDILNQGLRIKNQGFVTRSPLSTIFEQSNGEKTIIWRDISLKIGEELELTYTFDAPDISPYLYLLGPLEIGAFKELRSWQIASDADTGQKPPSQVADGTNACDSMTNVYTNNAADGFCDKGKDHYIYGYSFGVPAGSTIDGIKVEFINAWKEDAGKDSGSRLQLSWNNGTNWTGWKNIHLTSTTDANYSAGGATDDWIHTWTVTEINSNFRVHWENQDTGNEGKDSVDYMPVTVYYSVAAATISGTSDSSGTVAVAVNGALQSGKTGTISGGAWSISNVSVSSGNTVTVWVDGATEANESTGVAKYDGTGDMTGMVLNKHVLSIGSVDNQSLTVTNLGQYDHDQDEDIMHSANTSVLNIDAGGNYTDEKIDVLSGDTLTIGGTETLTTHDVAVNGSLTSGGSGTFNISGSWDNNNDFNANTETITFNATSGTETIDSTGATDYDFNNLTLGQTSGTATWNLSSALDVNGNLTIDYGTLAMNGSHNINLAGNLAINANGSYTKGTATTTFDGSVAKTWTDSNGSKQDMGTVVVDGSSKTINLGSSVKATKLTIGADDTLGAGGHTVTITGSGTGASRSFIANGTFNEATSTVEFTGTATTSIEAETYYNLTINHTGTTFELYNNATTTNNLTISNGTLDTTASNYNLWVGGNWSNSDTFTARSGTVTLNATDSGNTITTNGSPFYALTCNGSNGIWDFQDAATTTNDVTITAGTLDLNGKNLIVQGGNISVSGTLAADVNTGTVTLSGTGSLGGSGTTTVYNMTLAGAATLAGDIDVNNDLTISGANSLNASASHHNITVGGSWSNSAGTFTAQQGTVTFDAGSVGKTVNPGSSAFYNLTFNNGSGGWTFQDNATTSNNFTITLGTVTAPSSGAIAVGNNYFNSGTFTHNSSTVRFYATDSGNTITAGGSPFYALTMNGSNGVWDFQDAATTTNDVTITAGTLDLNGQSLVVQGGDISVTGTLTADVNTGAVTLSGTGSLGGTGTTTVYNLTLAGGTTLAGDIDVNNDLTISGTNSLNASASHHNITVGGSWSNSAGTFTCQQGAVTFDAGSIGKTVNPGSSAFYVLTFNGSGGGWQLQTNDLDVDNNLNLTDGTLDASSQNITVAGNLTLASGGLFTKGTGTLTFNGSGTNTWTDSNASKQDMGTTTIDGTSKTINLGSDVKVTKLTIGANDTFGAGSHTFTVTGFGTGVLRPFLINSGGTFNANTSLAEFTGGDTTDIESTTYYSLKLNQAGTTFQLYNDATTTNAVDINAGTLDVTANHYNLVVGGNWTNGDTFTSRNGTVTFYDNSATSTFSGDTTFFNFTCDTASKPLEFTAGSSATTTISGTLTLDGQACETQVKLRSTVSSSYWYINATATTSINYIDIKDSYAVTALTAETSEDSTGNYNWTINGGICVLALTQNDYRWYANIDNITPVTALAATNTAITNATSGTVFRIRMNLSAGNQNMSTGTQAFTLQYATTTYLGNCTSSLDWTSVGQPASSSVWRWRGYDNSSVNEEDTITTLKLGTSEIKESYEEANNSTTNPTAISAGQEGEWDWVVQHNVAFSTTTYCFRMIKSGGETLDGYTNYPKVTSCAPATWMAAEDASTTVATSTNIRLRLLTVNTGSADASDYNYYLEYAPRTGDTCGDETFVPMPISTSTGPFEMATSSYFRWNDPTSHQLSDYGAYGFAIGDMVEDPYATSSNITLGTSILTEVEYKFYVTADAGAGWYCFRTTNDGVALDNYNTYAELEIGTSGINISGTCKQHNQTDSCTDTGTVRVAVNGNLQTQTQTTVAGTWTISGISPPNAGDVITVFIDGADDAHEAVGVTKYVSGNVTGIDLYERHLSIGSDDNQTITNIDLSKYDNASSTDEDVFHEVDAANDLTVDTTGVFADEELYIKAGNTYRPDSTGSGNVSTHDVEIDGTFVADGNTITVQGSWDNDSTFTATTSTVTFAATASGETISTGGSPFYNLTFNGSGGGWTFSDNATTTNDLTITDGAVEATSSDPIIDVNGNFTVGSNGTFTASETNILYIAGNYTNSGTFTQSSGTTTFDGTTQQTLSGTMIGTSAFHNLKITNSSGSDPVTSPSLIFSNTASSTGLYVTTASVKLRFAASMGYTFTNFHLDGKDTTTRVQLRSSTTSTAWKLYVTGTQSVLNTDVKDSDASGGLEIDATNSSNLNSTGNTNWNFGGDYLSFSISDNTIGFAALSSGAARFATGDKSLATEDTEAHTLTASTTASDGYTITVRGATLTSGSNTINAIGNTAATSSPGTKQFGIRVVPTGGSGTAASPYNHATDFAYNATAQSTDVIASCDTSSEDTTYSMRYMGNITTLTEAGEYSTTITYVITANF